MKTADQLEKKEASRRYFDRWAGRYERDPWSRRLADLQSQALDSLQLDSRDRLVDVGCGTGAAVRAAASTVDLAVGVDLSTGMIARARELAAGIPNVEFHEADSESLPFEDGSFSALLCTLSFHHYPSPERAVDEMARVVAAGGRILLADGVTDRIAMRFADALLRRFQHSHVGDLRSEELEALLVGAGFAEPDTRFAWHGCYALVAARKPG